MIGRTNAGSGSGVRRKKLPEFTYTGEFKIEKESETDWRLYLLTSGTLQIQRLNSAEAGVDVFLCGGGGGGGSAWSSISCGGGGGYVKTSKNVLLEAGTQYPIVIGSGGRGASSSSSSTGTAGSGGTTTFNGATANGGGAGTGSKGGSGGSGGGGRSSSTTKCNGGTNGSNGTGSNAGTGSGVNMHEFGDNNMPIYGGGGGGYSHPGYGDSIWGSNGDGSCSTANRGGGGHAGVYSSKSAAGMAGVVVIRNRREADG